MVQSLSLLLPPLPIATAITDSATIAGIALISIRRYLHASVPNMSSYRLGGFSLWGGTLASIGALFCAIDDVITAVAFSVFVWATVIISIGLWFISDDALESWCKRCSFAAQDKIDFFENFEEEITGFYTALQEVA